MTTRQSDHWSDYWSRACLTSLPQDFARNYDGEVAQFWNGIFAETPENGVMVDLCTGNGAIALLAAAYAAQQEHELSITAVDAATIRPDVIAGHFPEQADLISKVNFVGDSRVEDLDFEEGSFDLVTSQYGVEYCDWQLVASQVARLLKEGGRLVMVNHTATSDIMRFMEQEHQQYGMLEKAGFFSSIEGYLAGSTDYTALRSTLEDLYRNLNQVVQHGGPPLFRSVHGMLAGVLSMDSQALQKGRQHLEAYYAQTRHGFDRLADMLRVNLAIQADPQWYSVFESAGLELQESGELLYRGKHHAGAWFKFVKPTTGKGS